MDTLFALFRLICQDLLKFRVGRVYRAECSGIELRAECSGIELREEIRREFPGLSVVCGRI